MSENDDVKDGDGTPFRDTDVAFVGIDKLTLIQNRAQCLFCYQIIQSTHRHEFVYCRCRRIAVDGGLAYARRVGQMEYINDLNVYGPPSISKSEARRFETQILAEA